MRKFAASLLLLVSLGSAPAGAEPRATDDEPGEIIVEGQRNWDEKAERFVDALTPATARGQIARFEAPVCPLVAGLSGPRNRLIAERIRNVAGAVGIPIAKPGCDATILLFVVADKADFLRRLQKEEPDYFPAEGGLQQLRRMVRDPSPAAAWRFEGLFRSDGREMPKDFTTGYYVQRNTTESPSRLAPLGRRGFITSVIVVQASALEGLTTTQLADYAAMRAFVRTDPYQVRDLTAATILNAIDTPMGAPVPLSLTEWDFGFLKAFYASGKNRYASYQRSDIRNRWKQERQADEAPERD